MVEADVRGFDANKVCPVKYGSTETKVKESNDK